METKVDYVAKLTIYTMPLEDLFQDYEALAVELAPLLEGLEERKKEIVRRVKQRGENVEHGNVKATYRSGYTRQTWNGKGLMGYSVANPEILAFQSEREVGPSVSVKLLK